ncbi:unnamed protein product, partial [Pocillopora meandrina]
TLWQYTDVHCSADHALSHQSLGARGGTHSYNYGYLPGTYNCGKGAFIEGKFRLNNETVLNIVVGQRGGDSVEVEGGQSTSQTAAQLRKSVEDNAGTGGGGGSFGASYHGGVGAGWFGQGCTRLGSSHGERGGSRAQGWIGGQAGNMNSGNNGGPAPGAVGGFGGGGGGSEDNGASGGVDGYSGGGSGTHRHQAGGGGGSYCSGEDCSGLSG